MGSISISNIANGTLAGADTALTGASGGTAIDPLDLSLLAHSRLQVAVGSSSLCLLELSRGEDDDLVLVNRSILGLSGVLFLEDGLAHFSSINVLLRDRS